jgi:hypothetical protein
MAETLKTVLGTLLLLFQSRSRLQVEILVLRQQLNVLRRTAPKRVRLRAVDRLLFVALRGRHPAGGPANRNRASLGLSEAAWSAKMVRL